MQVISLHVLLRKIHFASVSSKNEISFSCSAHFPKEKEKQKGNLLPLKVTMVIFWV
jgi:hypothetical protein